MTTNSINNASSSLTTNSITFDNGVNNLTTYTEATFFTPILKFGGSTTGITYNFQQAYYSIIGSFCSVILEITLSNKGSATGSATIDLDSAIPTPSLNLAVVYAATYENLTYTALAIPCFKQVANIIYITNMINAGAQNDITDTGFANNTQIVLTCCYNS